MDIVSFILADICYIISLIFYKKKFAEKGWSLLIVGLLFHSTAILGRGLLAGYPPFFTLYEILIFFSWTIVFLSLITGFHKISGIFTPLISIIIFGIVCFLNPGIRTNLPEELNTVFFPIHVSACLLGYGAFFVAFICGIYYLVKSSDFYDKISQRAVVLGMIFFSYGIIIGSVWAKQAWGSYWSWDPKETAALISWFIYAIWLLTRFVFGWKGKRSAWLSITGFCAIIFTWFGVNIFIDSLHSYK